MPLRARGQRDWPGFFSALAGFFKEILPLLLPLFVKTATTLVVTDSAKESDTTA